MAGDSKENYGLLQVGSYFIVLASVIIGYGNIVLTKKNAEIWENGDNREYICEYNDITDGNDGHNY